MMCYVATSYNFVVIYIYIGLTMWSATLVFPFPHVIASIWFPSLEFIKTCNVDMFISFPFFNSTLFWRFLIYLIKALLTNNNVQKCKRLVITLPSWYTIMKHPKWTNHPKGSGIWWGYFSTTSQYNSFQSALRLKTDLSTCSMLGSITNIFFGLLDRKWNIRYNASRWISWGNAWYCDRNATSIWISILLNSTDHSNNPISFWNQDTFLASHSSITSSSFLYPYGSGYLWGCLPIFNSLLSSDNKYLIICTAATTQ